MTLSISVFVSAFMAISLGVANSSNSRDPHFKTGAATCHSGMRQKKRTQSQLRPTIEALACLVDRTQRITSPEGRVRSMPFYHRPVARSQRKVPVFYRWRVLRWMHTQNAKIAYSAYIRAQKKRLKEQVLLADSAAQLYHTALRKVNLIPATDSKSVTYTDSVSVRCWIQLHYKSPCASAVALFAMARSSHLRCYAEG